MANHLHPTAIIAPDAELGNNITIGPFAVISSGVKLADGVCIKSHVVIEGDTYIGANTVIHPFAVIGSSPQDKKFYGENSRLEIGQNNTIREHVTINPGTEQGGLVTKIGDNNLIMVGCHIAHDCRLGNNIVMANNATLGGHVVIEDNAIIGGLSGIHQFVRIGAFAIIGGMSGVARDVIPYGNVSGERANLNGLNLIGLKRGNFNKEQINSLRNAYKEIFANNNNYEQSQTLSERLATAKAQYPHSKEVAAIINFINCNDGHEICLPKNFAVKSALISDDVG